MPAILEADKIEALLHQQYIGRLGCHSEDITYVVPITYAYDGDYIYGHAYHGMKIDMMKKNPHVCLQVDDIDSMFNWVSVIAWGEFEILDTDAGRLHAQTVILGRSIPFAPPDMMSPEVIAYRIRITKKTGRMNESHLRSARDNATAPVN
jgi:hypothetical protein